jgi:hypothetical protein
MPQPALLLSLLLGALLTPSMAVAEGAGAGTIAGVPVNGLVYADHNGNGRRDPGEPGLPGIAVASGGSLARTGADGRYRLVARPGDPVFLVKPDAWRPGVRADGMPDVWRDPGTRPAASQDFGLRRAARATATGAAGLQVLVFADPQVKTPEEVSYYARDIIEPVLAGPTADLGLTLGDVVDDVPALYPAMKEATARLGVPWLHAPGNHDVDLAASTEARALGAYRSSFGPDTFAWEEPEASFVVLNDVIARPGARPAYIGGLRDDQFAFLEAYLAGARRDRLLVLALHIPLFDTGDPGEPGTFRGRDRERLFALLRDFPKLLVLSGHRHAQTHHFHSATEGWHGARPLHEFNVGAASGAYWSGVADAAGIPDATMADGTPNGHARLAVDAQGGYALSWHPARLPPGDEASTSAMALHAPAVLRRGAYPAFGVYANVYMGHAATRVEFRIDDGDWQPMVRVLRADPRLLLENARDDLAGRLRGRDRSPEAEPSPHLWRGTLPTRLAPGEHAIEVRAFDDWQGEQRARTRYRLEAWADQAVPTARASRGRGDLCKCPIGGARRGFAGLATAAVSRA